MFEGAGDGIFEVGAFFVVFVDESGEDFGVGFGFEIVVFELFFELFVVFYNTVVDEENVAGAVGVGVLLSDATVGRPAGVSDADVAGVGGFSEQVFQSGDFADGSGELGLIAVV